MIFGYSRDLYVEYGIKLTIEVDLVSHPHALITGSSGSGKSTALLYLLGMALKSDPEINIIFADFKNSEDFRFLDKSKHYCTGKACYSEIVDFYNKTFTQIRESGQIAKRYLLIIDEYPAFLTSLQTMDKINKSKQANDILGIVSEILMLGRGLNVGIWIVTQRADSSWFSSGSRDNFMINCCLGNISKEQKTMLFAGEEIPEHIYNKGEGILNIDGRELLEVKFPKITDIDNWKKRILEILCPNDEVQPRR